jgi:hypothetical protein
MKAEAFKQKCIGRAPLVHRLGSGQPLRNLTVQISALRRILDQN